MLNFFTSQVDEYGDTTYAFTNSGYTLFVVIMLLAVFLTCFFTSKDNKFRLSARQLAVSSVCIALAFVTSNIKLIHLPQGGSVTLFSMFFICFVGHIYGLRSGIMAGVSYGLLQMLIDPYIISVPQMLLDYVFAFGALGLSGLFSKKKNGILLGYLTGIIGRMFFAVLSGIVFFGMYAPEGQSVLIYSLSYNGLYIMAEAAITLAILAVPAVRKALVRVKIIASENDSRYLEAVKQEG
ncbi:energy-coupled thiamine transporter ThiT [Butyrivibrio sp. MC2013]|uniref:energy-coupled thiamine transporter ThiT n=1 Tax=Butyrivibrio sp. MC2013 TaxID=1280686 RepID=UPI0003FB13F6|nr:energy-coupled thiamine transporter ThiT [Butyrivibrio sp. MC2013]